MKPIKTFLFLIIICLSNFGTKAQTIFTENRNIENQTTFVKGDTLFVKGKYLIYTKPVLNSDQIIENDSNQLKFESFETNTKDSLRNKHKIITTKTRFIKILTDQKSTLIDRINPQIKQCNIPISYSVIKVFNDYFHIHNNPQNNETYYYNSVKRYFSNSYYEKIFETKYVISRNGLNIRDEKGVIDGKFNYGDFVGIIGYEYFNPFSNEEPSEKWAVVKKNYISGNSQTTKKRYVHPDFLGEKKEIKVYQDQLCWGYLMNDAYEYDERDLKCLNSYFDFEIISETNYKSITSILKTSYPKNPKVKISQTNDVGDSFRLPIKDSVITFTSTPGYSGSYHSYNGDIELLNKYLIHSGYPKAEEEYYVMIDRTTGEESLFSGFPHLSPDNKHILSIYYDMYEDQLIFNIFSIKDNKSIKLNNSFVFNEWLKVPEASLKWISNSKIAFPITNQMIYRGGEAENLQYLVMTIK